MLRGIDSVNIIFKSSKILDKSFIKVVFYSFHLDVNFYRNTTSDQLIMLIRRFFNYDGVYYKEMYFDMFLVKPGIKLNKK